MAKTQITMFGAARSPGAEPFLRWAGGKQLAIPQLLPLLPPRAHERAYVEPFAGGGAMFFALQPARSWLMDANLELVLTYRAVRDTPRAVIDEYERLLEQQSEEAFHAVREAFNRKDHSSPPRTAAELLYLNHCGFNGLHRVNGGGGFNVPWGKRHRVRCNREQITRASMALHDVVLFCSDFRESMKQVHADDFVFLDPPYDGESGFVHYTAERFGEDDHRALADLAHAFARKGAFVMLTSSDTPLIRELYRDWHITEISMPRRVNGKGRDHVTELVIRSYQ